MKKFNLSLLAGALALAVAGQANAVTGTDLILSVWDTNTAASYTLDTGISMTTFTAGVTGTASTLAAVSPYAAGTTTLANASTTLSGFLAGLSAADYAAGDVVWNVTSDNQGAKSFKGAEILTTSASTPGASNLQAFDMKAVSSYYSSSTSDTVTSSGTAAASSGTFSSNMGGWLPGSNAGTLTGSGISSLGFYFMTPSSTSNSGAAAVAQFGNAAGMDMINLSSTGALTYTVAAAVPEPGEWLLILSGLALVGFIATRRKNSSMAFA